MTAFAVRPALPEDAEAICALLNAVDVIEIGRPETDLVSVRADLDHPEADLPNNSWVGFHGDELVVYGLLWDDSGADRIDMDQYVLPAHQEAAAVVLGMMEERARAKAAANGADRAVLHLHLNIEPTLDTTLLTGRGWRVVRRYHVLTRPLDAAADQVPAPPPGVTLRTVRDEADQRLAHALLQESFADHFDFQPKSYEKWLADLGELIDWDLVWIASAEGEGDVAAMVTSNHRAAHGWINALGVLERGRRRGLGGFLLSHAFGVYAGLGRDVIGLGVDTANATGAPRLYEAHDMSRHYAVDTWEVDLPVVPAPVAGAPAGVGAPTP
ncbi:GNAT family N-acetyltransferase [Streptomyces sp. NPDC006798]|uniref:GNAT family N-acetyltransferase n=1 Tax=Streptomyces sp. NPDC006798 TaxID=3155462 RepID=UPI0033F98640